MKRPLIPCTLGLLALLGGCCVKPDARAWLAKQAAATEHFQKSAAGLARADVKLRQVAVTHARAEQSNQEATRWVRLLVPAVDGLLLRVPAELQAEVQAIKAQVGELSLAIDRTAGPLAQNTQDVAAVQREQLASTQALAAGRADLDELNTQVTPKFLAEVNAMVRNNAALESKINSLLGWGGLILAGFAALGVSRFIIAAVPQTYAFPAGAFALTYVATWLIGRFWL